ncbi:LCP family protein [Cyanobium sp. CH-040]|uniref:LCP family protein n=1 Tax=Cyanobium sp. CH-040 TaxID=2823708 RepID=UPI0020CE7EEA|nr:LCP family protein [Cyanobium sp. CH-040]MCP9926563.1 LCP family protein [Cyanobium sp. CH-040]
MRLPRDRRQWGQLLKTGAITVAGAFAGLSLLNLVWPRPEPTGFSGEGESLSDLANVPNRPVTVLVIGVDADAPGDSTNGAAPAGPANADALLLLRINPGGPLQVLPLPANLAVQLPGAQRPQSLGSLYRSGGPALTADAVRELVGLPAGRPDRYLVLGRGTLRALVERLGTVEANPPRSMRYTDKTQDLKIDLQAGRQRLNPQQMEHLARWRDPARPVESRLDNQREVVSSLQRELSVQGMRVDLPALVEGLKGQVNSNLTRGEVLSLMAAVLRSESGVNFTSLPLAAPRQSEAAKATGLRELAASLPDPFWPEAKAGGGPARPAAP